MFLLEEDVYREPAPACFLPVISKGDLDNEVALLTYLLAIAIADRILLLSLRLPSKSNSGLDIEAALLAHLQSLAISHTIP